MHGAGVGEVGHIPCHLAAVQSLCQICLVHQHISCKVQDDNPVLHLIQLFLINHALGIRGRRYMDGNIITFLVDGIHAGNVLHIPVQHPGCIDRDKGVISIDLHPQSCGSVGYLSANRSQADHAQLLSPDLVAGKGFFALLRGLGNIGVLRILPAPFNSSDHITGGQKQSGQHQLLHAVGIGSGCIKYNYPRFCTGFQRNIIHTGPCSGHRQKALRQLHLMHGSAAHQNAVCFIYIVRNLIVLRQAVQTALCNRI